MKPHLLQILWDGSLGGTQRCVLELTRHIDLDKFDLTVAILSRGGPMTEQIDHTKIRVVEFGCTSSIDIFAFMQFYHFLKTQPFDIIHSHIRSILMNVVILIIRPRPVLVCHEHAGELLGGSGGYFRTRLFYFMFSNYYDVFITIHKEIMHRMYRLVKSPAGKIVVIENAVNIEEFSPLNGDSSLNADSKRVQTLGTIASLIPEKDLSLFLKAVCLINQNRTDVRFVIAGDGPQRTELEVLSNNLNLQERVTFVGEITNVPDMLRTFDLFMFTSRIEGFGLTLIEALACGVPVVAALPVAGGAKELLKQLPGIILVKQREPEELAKAANSLLEDPKRMQMLSKDGRDYIKKHYTMEIWVNALDRLYQRLLKFPKSSGDDVR